MLALTILEAPSFPRKGFHPAPLGSHIWAYSSLDKYLYLATGLWIPAPASREHGEEIQTSLLPVPARTSALEQTSRTWEEEGSFFQGNQWIQSLRQSGLRLFFFPLTQHPNSTFSVSFLQQPFFLPPLPTRQLRIY